MPARFRLVLVFLVAGALTAKVDASPSAPDAADSPRQHLSLDKHWKFHLGDDWPDALDLAKAGASRGPASPRFDDQAWRSVDLPHDWAVELPFDPHADYNHGFKPVGPGFPANDVGWYRRVFTPPAADAGRRVWLTFDGVYRDATVWVNGWLVRRHEGGYYQFREDITDVLRPGEPNTIAVRVDASKFEGWFYEGAGIYRHVWLDVTSPLALAPDGLFVRAEFPGNTPGRDPDLKVDAVLLNSTAGQLDATVACDVLSPDGRPVASFSAPAQVDAFARLTVRLHTAISSPVLWSPESPSLYTLVTTVSSGGRVLDREETPFGLRTIAFDPDRGFLLNGRPYMLKGTCNHQDHAGVGVALPDALQSYRVARLKEFGCNAYRTSHNPPTPELLDACDRLGMIVMDENRLLGSDSENMDKWRDMILRDRNHPSVCLWSIANEEFSVHTTPQAAAVARSMQALAKRLDPGRPVTYAAPLGNVFNGINGVIEVRGWNYNLGPGMDAYHRAHPAQPNVLTEQASSIGTRGVYANDKTRGYVSSYLESAVGWGKSPEAWWSFLDARPWLSGGFVWTGFDYRGEPTPYRWPCISSHFGILDTCGFPKDNFYYYQAWWTRQPVLHLVPSSWNWPGREGSLPIKVEAFANCHAVELFLNGRTLGRQTLRHDSHLAWEVPYAPGILSAKGYDDAGRLVSQTKIETTGRPVAVRLERDLTGLHRDVLSDGSDLTIYTAFAVDAQGRPVPDAQDKIRFTLSGPGRILGVGNGDPSSHEPDVFLPPSPRSLPVTGWHWKLDALPVAAPAFASSYDDSSWNTIVTKTDASISDSPLLPGQTAVYRAHVKLDASDLTAASAARLRFAGCDDQGWYYVNGRLVGQSSNWREQPAFDVLPYLQPGDNTIVVGVKNIDGSGGLNPDVTLQFVPAAAAVQWSRSLFNGLAQIIVQSFSTPGDITLAATADGLQSATVTLRTIPAPDSGSNL